MNPLYNQMNRNNPMTMLNDIKSNPAQFLAKRGVNVPNGMNDPNEIISHLMRTGRVSQNQYNQAVNMAQMFMK